MDTTKPDDATARDAQHATLDDNDLAERAATGDHVAFGHIMRRCNQRLFRVARGVLNNDQDAEDAVQDAYINAYKHLKQFRHDANLKTWLTRIVLNEAYGRLRKERSAPTLNSLDAEEVSLTEITNIIPFPGHTASGIDPIKSAANEEIRRLLEVAVAELPEKFRTVFVLREIETCSIEETAALLDIPQDTVKTRLHRAKLQLRETLQDTFNEAITGAFPFLGARCDRIVANVRHAPLLLWAFSSSLHWAASISRLCI